MGIRVELLTVQQHQLRRARPSRPVTITTAQGVPGGPPPGDGRAPGLAGCRDGNRLYLDKLSRVAESPDAKQCAWRVVVAETTDNFIPCRS